MLSGWRGGLLSTFWSWWPAFSWNRGLLDAFVAGKLEITKGKAKEVGRSAQVLEQVSLSEGGGGSCRCGWRCIGLAPLERSRFRWLRFGRAAGIVAKYPAMIKYKTTKSKYDKALGRFKTSWNF